MLANVDVRGIDSKRSTAIGTDVIRTPGDGIRHGEQVITVGLLARGDHTIAVEDDGARQLKRSIGIASLRLENIGSFEVPGKARNGDGSNYVCVVVRGGEGLDRERLTVSGDDCWRRVACGRATGRVQREQCSAVGVALTQQGPVHSSTVWIVADDSREGGDRVEGNRLHGRRLKGYGNRRRRGRRGILYIRRAAPASSENCRHPCDEEHKHPASSEHS